MADLREVVAWLDDYLGTAEIEDYPGALNGLQVDGAATVARVGGATDACQATIDLAVETDCELLLVHHGLFWGGAAPVVGPTFNRLSALIRNGVALYSSHLPLDIHDEVGNNVLLAESLGYEVVDRFGSHGSLEGLGVIVEPDVGLGEVADRLSEACGGAPTLIPGGPERVGRLAIVTGGAGSMISQAVAAGADAFITGEGNHHTYHEAMELGISVLYGGHYATETRGVARLAEMVAERFGVESEFFDVPTGL